MINLSSEAAKFVGDFKSVANKADTSLAKHEALELEIERLLKAVVSQDIMIIVQNKSVVDTSDLQTELERTKERFENCIIKNKNENQHPSPSVVKGIYTKEKGEDPWDEWASYWVDHIHFGLLAQHLGPLSLE
nr:hypothetical protein [Tanacetum cinerariifolium]